MILGVNVPERRISLGLKQALGDPWVEAAKNLTIGSVIEGPIVSVTKFGAFVQIAEGVEGMIHVSEISAEKRINHPQDVLKIGQTVKAQVLDVDGAKRNIRLSIKQMVPSSLDEYIAEHKEGDSVTGRVQQVNGGVARVELGEGVFATCHMVEEVPAKEEKTAAAKPADCRRSVPCFSRAGRAALRPQRPSLMRRRQGRFAASASASSIRRPRRLNWSWPRNNWKFRGKADLRAEPAAAGLETNSQFSKRFGANNIKLRDGRARVAEPTDVGLTNPTTSNLCKRFGANNIKP